MTLHEPAALPKLARNENITPIERDEMKRALQAIIASAQCALLALLPLAFDASPAAAVSPARVEAIDGGARAHHRPHHYLTPDVDSVVTKTV